MNLMKKRCLVILHVPSKSRVAITLKRLLSRRQTNNNLSPVRPLSSMNPGQSGTVLEIASPHHVRVERLQVLGLITDAPITLEQKNPTYVLRVGFTQLAVEREIADDILVKIT
jgi:DtxR family transcriptional regulator, Mn-dependent transcriptional regulator